MFKNRKNNKKGFTLVEVIVVLVILAILAAIMIPALTGWIDKANKKTAVVEARTYLLAIQTVASENYPSDITTGEGSNKTLSDAAKTDVETLADTKGTSAAVTKLDINKSSKVVGFVYTSMDGKYTVTYADKKFTVADNK